MNIARFRPDEFMDGLPGEIEIANGCLVRREFEMHEAMNRS